MSKARGKDFARGRAQIRTPTIGQSDTIEKMYSRIRIWVLLVMAATTGRAYAVTDTRLVVTGRVVDAAGVAVPNAIVSLESVCDCSSVAIIDRLYFTFPTDDDGKFRIEQPARDDSKPMLLFITGPRPRQKGNTPFSPPFWGLHEADSRFGGLPVLIGSDQAVLDLGDVRVQFYYGTVLLDLVSQDGVSLVPMLRNLRSLYLRVRSVKGDILSEGSFPNIARAGDAVRIILSLGDWHLELSRGFSEGSRQWHKFDEPIHLSERNTPLKVTLQLSSLVPPLQHVHRDRETARKGLEDIGFAYGDDVFRRRVRKGNLDAVELFLDAGIDPNGISSDGAWPLADGIRFEYRYIVETLLAHDADPNMIGPNGVSDLTIATVLGEVGILKLLIDAGAELDAQSDDGETALMLAALEGRATSVRALLDAGADARIKNNKGQTALMLAKERKYKDIAELLKRFDQR